MELKINPKYIGTPTRLPLLAGVVLWLLLDRLQAEGVWLGVAWTIYGIIFLGCVCAPLSQKWGKPRIDHE